MTTLNQKINSLKKILITNKSTIPKIMGNKILLLATAPSVSKFFESADIRNQFKEYDIAFINYMIVYSEDKLFLYKPKYIILLDPIFYQDDFFGIGRLNQEKAKVISILERIDWDCCLLTSVLADFPINNNCIDIIRLSCFEIPYRKFLTPLYKRNWINMGINNVMHGAIYFAITFGYKTIAVLGCSYQMPKPCLKEDGIHVEGFAHYYDLISTHELIPYNKIKNSNKSLVADIYHRGGNSLTYFWNLRKYADANGATIKNYSEESSIDAFDFGELHEKDLKL